MLSNFSSFVYETKNYICEDWIVQKHPFRETFLSILPMVGLIYICVQEFFNSKQILIAIPKQDIKKVIRHIQLKNCYKVYYAFHFLVMSIFITVVVLCIRNKLRPPLFSPLPQLIMIVALALKAINALNEIRSNHKIINHIRQPFLKFAILSHISWRFQQFDQIPDWTYKNFRFLIPSLDCISYPKNARPKLFTIH